MMTSQLFEPGVFLALCAGPLVVWLVEHLVERRRQ